MSDHNLSKHLILCPRTQPEQLVHSLGEGALGVGPLAFQGPYLPDKDSQHREIS